MAIDLRSWMALHLQEELEAQGVRIGGKRGVNLSKLTDAAMTAVRSTGPHDRTPTVQVGGAARRPSVTMPMTGR